MNKTASELYFGYQMYSEIYSIAIGQLNEHTKVPECYQKCSSYQFLHKLLSPPGNHTIFQLLNLYSN